VRQAEPLSLVLLWAKAKGGPEACKLPASSWVSYVAPDYIGWPKICALYPEAIESMLDILVSELGPEITQCFEKPVKIIKL